MAAVEREEIAPSREERPSLRAERAEVTRKRIADAARSLFATRGYGATTLGAVAAEAGVAVQTVYAVYGSKAGILRALRESVLREPAASVLFDQAVAAPDPSRKLELFARSIRHRWEYGHDVTVIQADAANTDPSERDELEKVLKTRRNGLGRLVRSLTRARDLPRGLDVAHATAIVDALTLPELYAELVGGHGWTQDEYERWLGATLKQQLFG